MSLVPATSILFLALASSAHCAAMCGPLCQAIGTRGVRSQGGSPRSSLTSASNGAIWGYQLGRILGYAVLGACAAALGRSAVESALAPIAPVLSGSVALVTVGAAVSLARGGKTLPWERVFGGNGRWLQALLATRGFLLRALFRVRTTLRAFLAGCSLPPPFAAGLLSALLPCGFLFAALGHAAATLDPYSGGASLALFAFATAPAVMGGARLLAWVGFGRRAKEKRLIAAGLLLVSASFLMAAAVRREREPYCLRVVPHAEVRGEPKSAMARDTLSLGETFRLV